MTIGDLVTLLRLRDGEVALVEKPTPDGAKSIGRQVKDLRLPENAVCVAVLREGKVLFPRTNLVLQVDDRVLVSTTIEQETTVAEVLAQSHEPRRTSLSAA